MLLIVFILRHGEAEAKSSRIPDEERHLTDLGSERLRRNLVIAREIGTMVELILTSPFLRAKESAEIAGDIFQTKNLLIEESLAPTRYSYEVFETLTKHRTYNRVLLVTHQPLVSSLMAGLLNWDESFLAFSPGTMAGIEVDDLTSSPRGTLIFLLPSIVE